MLRRILTAIVLIPIVVALVWWGPAWLLAAIAALISILALVEFFDLGERVGMRAFRKWTFVCTAALYYAQHSQGLVETHTFAAGYSIVRNAAGGVLSLDAVLLIFVFGAASIALATRWALHEVLPAIAISSAGLLFVALPFSYLVRLNEISIFGRQLVLFTLCLIWAGDIFGVLRRQRPRSRSDGAAAAGEAPSSPRPPAPEDLWALRCWASSALDKLSSLALKASFSRSRPSFSSRLAWSR